MVEGRKEEQDKQKYCSKKESRVINPEIRDFILQNLVTFGPVTTWESGGLRADPYLQSSRTGHKLE